VGLQRGLQGFIMQANCYTRGQGDSVDRHVYSVDGPKPFNPAAVNAFDWKASVAGALDLDVFQLERSVNDERELPALDRIAKPLDRAINSFIQEWLGVCAKCSAISSVCLQDIEPSGMRVLCPACTCASA
jgi:hypothetical protein